MLHPAARAEWTSAEPVELLRRALNRHPSGLFCDLDGTVSPLIDLPQRARVLPGCRSALRRLGKQIDLLCILSGRPADEAWRMVGLDDALYVGAHGVETWYRGELLRPPGVERYEGRLARARSAVRDLLARVPGLVFEDKGLSFAIHYRRNPAAAILVLATATRIGRQRGLQVAVRTDHVEMRIPVEGDKGSALSELASRHGLRGLAAAGDDPVDTPAFVAAHRYGRERGATSVTIGVGPRAAAADVSVPGPAALGLLLVAVARSLER